MSVARSITSKQSVAELWVVPRNVETSIAADEFERIQEELNAATWVRNMRSSYQLREVMADFWNNHFNIGRQADMFAAAALPVYDAQVIRPRAFGNFHDLLTAVATSASMLRYLDNAASTAAHPNEELCRRDPRTAHEWDAAHTSDFHPSAAKIPASPRGSVTMTLSKFRAHCLDGRWNRARTVPTAS